ncbi:MAG: hypothetical protein MUF11_07285 [Beijerinckiaceae bacterium]|nr:hypothetical protein [Beijerinckiaceae bacterium]
MVTTIPSVQWAGQTFRVKLSDLNLINASLPREEIETLLKTTSIAALADGLAKLNADEFTLGSIEVETEIEGQKSLTVYQNFKGGSIVAGVFNRLEVAETRQVGLVPDASQKPMGYTTKFGLTTVEFIDPVTALRWFIDADPTGNAPFKPIHGPYVLADGEVSMQDFRVEIGRASASGVKLRLPRQPVIAMWPSFEAFMKKQATSPDEDLPAEVIANMLELYNSFEMGEWQVGAIKGTGKAGPEQEVTFKLGGMRGQGGAQSGGLIEGIEVSAKDGSLRLGNINWQGDFYKLIFAALGKLVLESDDIDSQPEAQVARLKAEMERQALPDIGFGFKGLDIDFEQKNKPDERIRASVGSFEMRNGAFVGVTPTRIGVKLANFRLPIQPSMKEQVLQQIRAMGIETLDLSFNLDGVWDEAKSTVTFPDISTSVEQVGALAMSFVLGNVPKALFEDPVENWTAVLLTGTAQQATLSLTNRGGFEKGIAQVATQTGKKPEQLRLEIATMAPMLLVMGLADHPDATRVTEAVGNFLKSLGELSVKVRAKDAEGVRLIEFAGAGNDPAALLKRLEIEALGK